MSRKNKEGAYWVMRRANDKQICEWAIEQTGGIITSAAELLGLNVGHLHQKVKDLDIRVEPFRIAARKAREAIKAEAEAAEAAEAAGA